MIRPSLASFHQQNEPSATIMKNAQPTCFLTESSYQIVNYTLDLDDLAEDLFLREEEVLLPCSEDVAISPSESEGKSFSSSSELSVTT